jgi:hypothetical protein
MLCLLELRDPLALPGGNTGRQVHDKPSDMTGTPPDTDDSLSDLDRRRRIYGAFTKLAATTRVSHIHAGLIQGSRIPEATCDPSVRVDSAANPALETMQAFTLSKSALLPDGL